MKTKIKLLDIFLSIIKKWKSQYNFKWFLSKRFDFTLWPKHIFVFILQNYPLFHSFRLWIMWITLWITQFYRKKPVFHWWITMCANNFFFSLLCKHLYIFLCNLSNSTWINIILLKSPSFFFTNYAKFSDDSSNTSLLHFPPAHIKKLLSERDMP